MQSIQSGTGREEAALILLELLRAWVAQLPPACRLPEASTPLPEGLARLLRTVMRLRHTCPHANVREAMTEAVEELARLVPLPKPSTQVSRYIGPNLIIPIMPATAADAAVGAGVSGNGGAGAGAAGGTEAGSSGAGAGAGAAEAAEAAAHSGDGGPAAAAAAAASDESDGEQLSSSVVMNAVVPLSDDSAGNTSGDDAADRDAHDATEQLDDAWREFELAFASDGRVSNMTRVMAFHPAYLTSFRETHNTLMLDGGALPLQARHLIAVMAATRHRCEYLIELHTAHFLDLGGDAAYLTDRDALPPKFRKLLVLNSLMAYQPWLITPQHLGDLLQGDDDRWSKQELVQAIVLMAHFHALCGFIFGLGIVEELDLQRHVLKMCELSWGRGGGAAKACRFSNQHNLFLAESHADQTRFPPPPPSPPSARHRERAVALGCRPGGSRQRGGQRLRPAGEAQSLEHGGGGRR
jgi:alkylhydroperoxidase/carboxymuconolactone decarboxylase family protein YurZ